MEKRTYTIGDVSRLSGVSVRRLRFYSDEGLLPPAARTESGYRVYSDSDLVRLDLIRSLREAGLSLEAIRRVLSRRLSLAEALTLRLEALEVQIAAQRRIAAALRTALRSPEPTEDDLRRIWTVVNLSNAERRAVIEHFFDQVSDGAQVDPGWKRRMIDASTPDLPDDPTPEQLDAWIELTAIVSDPKMVASMRASAGEVWNGRFDHAAYAEASDRMARKARVAIDAGLAASSAEAGAIAQEWLESSARAMQREPDDAYRIWLLGKYRDHDPRASRYWDLVAILREQPEGSHRNREWEWIVEAMMHHLA